MGGRNSGQRPRSHAAKLLRGVTFQGYLNPYEVRAPGGAVDMPAWLSMRAGTVWRRLAPLCAGMGTLTPADAEAFGALCTLQALLEQATDEKVILRATSALRQYYALFGLEPVSRTRIAVKPDQPVSKWATG